MKEIIHQLFVLLGFVYELSAEEKLDAIVSEHKHRSLLDDILRIRRSGDYVPNYNRQRLHTEYQLIKKDGSVISENEGQTITIKNLSNETIEIEEVSKIITRE